MEMLFQDKSWMEMLFQDKSWRRSPCALKKVKGITPTALAVYEILLDRCTRENNVVRISTSDLAKNAGRCLKSIVNAVKVLTKFELISKAPKQSPTEVNRFIVVKILDDKKPTRSSRRKQTAPSPEAEQMQSTQTYSKPAKPQKKKYGEYGHIRLTDEEYNSLIADFGEAKVSEYIQKADDYSKAKNRWYNNNAKIIRKWLEEDKDKPARHNSYMPTKMRPGKTYYNFRGKTYRDLIEELPEEQREKYYQKVFSRHFDEVATMPLEELLRLSEYEMILNENQQKLLSEPAPEPEPEPEKETVPPPSRYEMTDEEISTILDKLDCNIIYHNKLHPLFYCTPGELITLAEKWKVYKGL